MVLKTLRGPARLFLGRIKGYVVIVNQPQGFDRSYGGGGGPFRMTELLPTLSGTGKTPS